MFAFKVKSLALKDKLTVPRFMVEYLLEKLAKKFEMKNLGDMARKIISGSYVRNYVKKGELYLRAQNIRRNNVDLNPTDIKFVDLEGSEINDKIRIKKHDLVLSRTGLYLGSACVLNKNLAGAVISQHLTRIELKNKITPFYVATFLNSKFGKMQVAAQSAGMTRPELTHSDLNSIKVPILAKKSQEKIGMLVEDAGQKRVEALQLTIKAEKILSKELAINTETLPDEDVYVVHSNTLEDMFTPRYFYPKYVKAEERLTKNFTTVELGNLAEIERGLEVGRHAYGEEGIPFIRTTDIVNNEIDDYPDFFISESLYYKLDQDVRAGDILFTKDGKIGLAAMVTNEDRCVLASGIARIRIKNEMINPYYIFAFLNTDLARFEARRRTVVAATLPHLSIDRLKEMKIPIIPQEKQKEIGTLVKKAFELKENAKGLIKSANDELEKFFR